MVCRYGGEIAQPILRQCHYPVSLPSVIILSHHPVQYRVQYRVQYPVQYPVQYANTDTGDKIKIPVTKSMVTQIPVTKSRYRSQKIMVTQIPVKKEKN